MMNKSFQEPNLTMLTDFYELTMANGYFQTGLKDRICYFDVFYRSVPDNGGFALAAGLAAPTALAQRMEEETFLFCVSEFPLRKAIAVRQGG